ncbi:hypothetical protein [Escherichia coli]|uniref:hypothetical protein n=1 Tax=Escherichia coli TaxID=562 RepID=UPI0010700285|nr:hypothetical protein [Escherichia coli]
MKKILLTSVMFAFSVNAYAYDSYNAGDNSQANDSNATAIGAYANASGSSSSAIGAVSKTEGDYNTAIGSYSSSQGR